MEGVDSPLRGFVLASRTRDRADVLVLHPPTVLDLQTRDAFKQEARNRVPTERPKVVVDLAGVQFVDSEGLSALLSLARTVHERGGELRFASPSPAVERLFRITRLYFVFETYASREEALESF
jgi:anti-sigma B factor antagonist